MLENIVSIRLPVNERMHIRKNRRLPRGVSPKDAGKLPRLAVITGTHGDELEGQFVCWLLNRTISEHPECLAGVVDIYPALNPLGVDTITRGIPCFDLDMNRIFPGNSRGTSEEVIASKIVEDIAGASCAVDIHASNIFIREIPQVRVNVNTAGQLVPLAKLLNCDFIWVHAAATVLESTLAWSLNSIGTPCLVAEMGVGMRITQDYGRRLVQGLLNLMRHFGIWTGDVEPVIDPIVSTDGEVHFINANRPGVFVPVVEHWKSIRKHEVLGLITDPATGDVLEELRSPADGLVFTLREYPVVNPGSLIARILGVGKANPEKEEEPAPSRPPVAPKKTGKPRKRKAASA